VKVEADGRRVYRELRDLLSFVFWLMDNGVHSLSFGVGDLFFCFPYYSGGFYSDQYSKCSETLCFPDSCHTSCYF
jgi:hypothetical protein